MYQEDQVKICTFKHATFRNLSKKNMEIMKKSKEIKSILTYYKWRIGKI